MTVSGGITGSTNNGTTSVAYAVPASGYDADSGTLCVIGWGAPAGNTPSTASAGWSLIGQASGGSGVFAADSGLRGVAAFWKEGASPGDPTISLAGTGCVQVGRCIKFQKTEDHWSTPQWQAVADATSGTTFSGTFGADPGAEAGDMALLIASWVSRANTPSSPSITWPSMSVGALGTECNVATTAGNDARCVAYSGALTGGPSSGAPSFSITASGAVTGEAGIVLLNDYDDTPTGPEWTILRSGIAVPADSVGILRGGVFVPFDSSEVKV